MITFVEAMDAGEKWKEEKLAWLKAKNYKRIPQGEFLVENYLLGYDSGWNECLAYLRQKGYKFETRRVKDRS